MLIDKSIYSTGSQLPEEEEEGHPLASKLGSHYLLSEDYVYGEDKKLVANQAFMHWASDQEAEKKGTVKAIRYEKNDAGVLEKVEKDFPMFNGESLTPKGQEEYDRVKRYFDDAASMPNGGVSRNPTTRKWEVDRRLESVFTEKQEKRPDPFKDMSEFIDEKLKITPEGDSPAYTYEDYTGFHNAAVKNGEAHLDPSNKEMKTRFLQEVNRRTFDSSLMDESEIGRKVAGAYVINPKNYSEVDKVESWIDSLTDLSASDKKMMLIDYRSKIEANVGTLVNDFAAADAGVIGGIFSSPLRDEFNEYMSKRGASGYQFLKDNKERMSKDSYGVASEIATKFRDSVMATGTGFLWAASAGNYTSAAEAWGGLAEDSSKAYSNGKAFELFGVDINRRDLTELTGQIGSFVATGGMGALAGKGLMAIGAKGTRYAVNQSGILLSTVARTEAAAAAGTRTFGQKTLGGLKALGTDPEMYLGSLQAAGMSFGKTFNSKLEETGSREEALKAANIDAIADGFGALIATGVMNRFAPGMGKVLGMGDGAVGGGIVQAFKNKTLAKESMEEVQTALNNLSGKIGEPLRKQFANDIGNVMSASARSLGLKGVGIFGNMGAEAIEEASDEIISDVISSMLDDSKTWNEEVWQNIGTKWKEYVKAGVLGAIGGAMGDATSTILSPKETFGTSEGLKLQTKEWDRIKTNVKQFESLGKIPFPAPIKDAKDLAEYIAMPDGKVSIEQKSDAMLAAVRNKTLFTSMVNANVPVVNPVADAESSATANAESLPTSADATNSATSASRFATVMSNSGLVLPEGRVWRDDISLAQVEGSSSLSISDKVKITPLSTVADGNETNHVTYVAAKKETTNPDSSVTTEYLSAKEAAAELETVIPNLNAKNQSEANNLRTNFLNKSNNDSYNEQWSTDSSTVAASTTATQVATESDLTAESKPKSRNSYINPNALSQGVVPESELKRETIQRGSAGARIPVITFKGGKSVPDLDAVPEAHLSLKLGDVVTIPSYDRDGQKAQKAYVNSSRPSSPSRDNDEVAGDVVYNVTYENRTMDVSSWEIGSIISKKNNSGDQSFLAEEPASRPNKNNSSTAAAKGKIEGLKKLSDSKHKTIVENKSKVANDAGIDVVVVDSAVEAIKAMELQDYPEVTGHITDTSFAAFGYITKSGRKIIIFNSKEAATGMANFEDIIRHEMLHVAEFEFRATPQGAALFKKASESVDKKSLEFDSELNSFMEKEYPGYSKINDKSWRMNEVVRAFLEGELTGVTSGMESFKAYVKAFINYVKDRYVQDSDMMRYIAGVEAKYKSFINDANDGTAAALTSDVQDETSDDIDPLEALVRELELKDSEPENNTIGSSETGTTDVFSYKQEIAKEVAAIAGYLPAPKEKKTGGTTIIPSGPVIYMGSLNQERVSAIVDRVLTQTEKIAAARALKENSWNDSAKKKFGERMADWMVSGKEFNSKLIELFKKVWKAITLAGIAGAVAVSPMSDRNNVSIVTVSPESLNPSTLVNPNIKPTSTVINAPLESSKDYNSSNKSNILVSKEDSSIGTTPTRTSSKSVSVNFDGAEHTTNVRVVANWVLQNADNKGLPFSVADKQEGTVYFFDSEGNLTIKTPALFGKKIADYTSDEILAKHTNKINDEEKITPAGRFETYNKTSTPTYGTIAVYRVGSYTDLAFHKVYLKKPSERRLDRLASKTGKDNRISHGCINLPTKLAESLIPTFKNGHVTYILPETKAGKETFDGFKDLVIPSDSNNLALNEAGLDPLSAFLMAMAGMALAKKRKGASRTEIQEEINSALAGSRLSDQKKQAALVRLNNVLDQSFPVKPSPEKIKQQTPIINEQQNDPDDGSDDGSKNKIDAKINAKIDAEIDAEIDAKEVGKKDGQKEGVLTELEAAGGNAPAVSNSRNKIRLRLPGVKNTEPDLNKENTRIYKSDGGIYVSIANNPTTYVTDNEIDAEIERQDGDLNKALKAIKDKITKLGGNISAYALEPQEKTTENVTSLTYQDVTYVADPNLIIDGTDAVGGNWKMTTDSKTNVVSYTYRPPVGSALSLGIGEIVAIDGKPDEFLVVKRVFNGRWDFEKKNAKDAAGDIINDKGLIQQGNKFARSRLSLIAKKFEKHFESIVQGKINSDEMEKLFLDVLKIVSPKKEFVVVNEDMSKKKGYVYASPNTENPDDFGSINVDYKKLAEQLTQLYHTANTKNQLSNALLGMDAARVVAAIIDEELTHLIGFKIFDPSELFSFYRSILDLPKNKDGTDHPFKQILSETLAERFPQKKGLPALNPEFEDIIEGTVGGLNDSIEVVQTVATEMIRKLHQMATRGTTTERDTELSRQLQAAIYGDAEAKSQETAESKVKGPLNVIGQIIRRYAERVRNILWMKWQQGMLPPITRDMLAKLNKAYQNEGIQGDVDFGYDAATEESERRVEQYEKSFVDETSKIARISSPAIMKLRSISKEFGYMSLSESLVVDKDTMALSLRPSIQEHIKKNNLMDLDLIDKVLFELNGEGVSTPSYQKAVTVAFLKQQVMDLKRDSLTFNPSDLFDSMKNDEGLFGNEAKNAKSAKQSVLWRQIVEGIPENNFEASLKEVVLPLVSERNKMWEERDRLHGLVIQEAFKAVNAIDTDLGGFTSIKALIKWGRLAQVKRPGKRELVNVYDDFTFPSEPWFEFQNPADKLINASPEESAQVRRDFKESILQSLTLSLPQITGERQVEFLKSIGGPVSEALAELKSAEKSLETITQYIETIKSYKQSLKFVPGMDSKDRDTLKTAMSAERDAKNKDTSGLPVNDENNVLQRQQPLSPEAQAAASSIYKEYIEFSRAVDDYNKSIQFVKNRALGEFGTRSEEFGMNYADMNKATGKNATLEFKNMTDELEPASTSNEVFSGNMVPEGMKYGYGSKARFDDNGEPLSEEEKAWNAGLEVYRYTMQSNADFVGKNLFLNYWVNLQLGKVVLSGVASDYEKTGGFLFKKQVNEIEMVDYETADQAFPDLLTEELGEAKLKLKSGGSEEILNVIRFFQKTNEWSSGIKSKYQGVILDEVGGEQSFASRMIPMLHELFGKMESMIDPINGESFIGLTEGLDFDLKAHVEDAVKFLSLHYEMKDFYMKSGNFVMPAEEVKDFMDFFKMKDGKLIKKSTRKDNQIAIDFLSQLSASNKKLSINVSLRSATQGVKLMKRSFKAFSNPRWKRNVEQEGSRYQRDPAYEPDNKAILKLGEMTADARMRNQMKWNLKYFETSRNYIFGSNWAFEFYNDIQKSNYGEGREPYVRINASAISANRPLTADEMLDPQRWSLKIPNKSWTIERLEKFDPDELDYNNPLDFGDKKETKKVTTNYLSLNPESEVINPNEFSGSEDDPRLANSSMSTTDPTVKGYTQTYNEARASTPQDAAERAFGRPAVTRSIKVTQAAMFIGSNGPNGRSSSDADQFYFDMIRLGKDSDWFTSENIIEERNRSRNNIFFPNLSDDQINSMENREIMTVFRQSMTDSLVRRGLKGSFPALDYTSDKTHDKIYNAFLDEYGNKTDKNGKYRFVDSEKFVLDLLEFKMKFERAVVEENRVKNQDEIAIVYDLISKGNQFVSPDESGLIAKVVKESMTSEKLDIFDTRLGTGPGTGNAIVDNLVDTLPGKTLIVTIRSDVASKNDLNGIGIQIFKGNQKKGEAITPNVVFMPLNQNGPYLSQNKSRSLISQLLSISAENNSEVKKTLLKLSSEIDSALNPVKLVSGLIISWRSKPNKKTFVPKSRYIFDAFNKMAAIRSYFDIVSKSLSFPGIDPNLADSIIMVSAFLTNDEAKTFLDQSYKGFEVRASSDLSQQIQDDLLRSVWMIRQSKLYETDRFGDETDNIGSETTDNNNDEEYDEDEDEFSDPDKDVADNPDPTKQPEESLEKSEETNSQAEFVKQLTNIQDGELETEMVIASADFGINDASDMLLFNALVSIVEAGIKSENPAFIESLQKMSSAKVRKSRSTRNILENPELGGSVGSLRAGLAAPVVKSNANEDQEVGFSQTKMGLAVQTYIGESINMARPNVKGRTVLNSKFASTRINNINAALIYNLSSVENQVEEQLTRSFKSALGASAKINFKNNTKNGTLDSVKIFTQQIEVVVNDELLSELGTNLPAAELEVALSQTRKAVEDLYVSKNQFETVLASLKNDRGDALVRNSENVTSEWANTPTSMPDEKGKRGGRQVSQDELSNAMSQKNAELAKSDPVFLVDKLRVFNRQINRVQADLLAVKREISKVENYRGQTVLGRSHFKANIGLDILKNEEGAQISTAVEEAPRKVGFNIITTPFFDSIQERARWMDISSDKAIADVEIKDLRKEHYIKEQAMISALTQLATDHIDDAYKISRNTADNFMDFNPLKAIRQAIEISTVESIVLKDQMEMARTDAEVSMMRGLEADDIAMLTDPASTDLMVMTFAEQAKLDPQEKAGKTILTPNQYTRLRILNMPKSMRERSEKIGSLFSQEGQNAILMPTTVREQLMRAFPATVTRKNVNSTIAHIAAEAGALSPSGSSNKPTDHSYFMNSMEILKTETFSGDEFSLTKGKAMTKEKAAKAFSAQFASKVKVFLNTIRNNGDVNGKRIFDSNGLFYQAQVEEFSFMLEGIVMVYNDSAGVLKKETKDAVRELLKSISENDERSFSSISEKQSYGVDFNTENMVNFRISKVFSSVFMDVETDLIVKRLTSSMTIHNGWGSLFTMKYLDHHDSRMRNRFQKNRAGRQAALHLKNILDRGVSGKSGRSAYETRKKAAQEEIAKAADKLDNNALDQTIGYFHAMLDGLDNSNGMTYANAFNSWFNQTKRGFDQYRELIQEVDSHYKGSNISKYWNANHIDLRRDKELTDKIKEILNSSKAKSDFIDESKARAAVAQIQKALMDNVTKGKEVDVLNYSTTLSKVLGDIDSAMHLTMAMLSQPSDPRVDSEKNKWNNREVKGYKRTYSSVPMIIGYAGNPKSKVPIKQGEYISDAMDIVAFDKSSFFGGVGQSSQRFDDKSVFRPIFVNGVMAPQSLIDDAIYRLNVTPTYEVLRRSLGKVKDTSGQLGIEDSGILEIVESQGPDINLPTQDYNEQKHNHDMEVDATTTALAFVANELETTIRNDYQTGVVNTGGAEVLRFLGSTFIVRSLASLQQITDQSVAPSIGYISGKFAIGKFKMALTYLNLVQRYLTDSKFREKARQFIMETDPTVYYRSLDGREVYQDVTKGQVRYSKNNSAKNKLGKGFRAYEKYGEIALNWSIGSVERVLATSVFLTELMDYNKETDVEKLFSGQSKFNSMDVSNSRIKVNDMFGQSDQGNKAWMFQTRDSSPIMSAIFKALSAFSNHTASVGSNMYVLAPQALNPLFNKINPKKYDLLDKDIQQEALENVVTTLVQNVLFAPLKAKMIVPMVCWVIARLIYRDDEDEAVRHAQEMANSILAPTEDGNMVTNAIKSTVFGKKREFFRSELEADAAFASGIAEIVSKTLLEGATALPFGVVASYSSVSTNVQKFVTNDAAESIVAWVANLEKSKFYFDDKGVMVRQYEANSLETVADTTAAGSTLYDLAGAAKLMAEYNMTDEASSNRMKAASNTALYFATEIAPFLRDARGQMQSVLKDAVKAEKD